MRPVQAGDLLGDVPGVQQVRRAPAGITVPGAQVQQRNQHRQLVGRGTAAGVDHLQQPLREPYASSARAGLVLRHRCNHGAIARNPPPGYSAMPEQLADLVPALG